MNDPFGPENNVIASWFYGPHAENYAWIRKFYKNIIDQQKDASQGYFPNDPQFITDQMKKSDEYMNNMKYLEEQLKLLSEKLAQKTTPFWSPRYMGHMSMEPTLPSNVGYMAALPYNQNNVAIESSPLTTWLEIFAGKQLCEMLGFNVQWDPREDEGENGDKNLKKMPTILPIQGWGHITCDGSVANLESIWAARNLKFYPLSLRLAIDNGSLSFIGPSFKVKLANSKVKLFKDCSTWELLNLKPKTILDIPDRMSREYGIPPEFMQNALSDYTIQTVGKKFLENEFGIEKPILYLVSTTMHYSWPKGCAITGIGSKNLRPVPVDNDARMNTLELEKFLEQCVKDKQAIYAVVAIMGSTEHGACDPLDDIINLRKKYESQHGLSFVIHADAAWGGYFRSMLVKPLIGPKFKSRLKGHEENRDSFVPTLALKSYTAKHLDSLKHCDSVTVDPHKSGYVPYPAGSICYRNRHMRYLNTWKSPVTVRPKEEESIGIYGVEGSKSAAAAVATWFSHDVIGLHQKGYGLLLGQATFSSIKLYCHWATMSTNDDDFIVTPFNMLPAEKCFPPNLEEIEKQKQLIRSLIVEKCNHEIVESNQAKELIKELGSDLMINTFACNFKLKVKENGKEVLKVNEDINEANYLNRRLYEEFSLTSSEDTNKNKFLILTSTQFKQENYGDCLKNFKNRLGLKGNQDLYVLINVAMTPWATESKFLSELTDKFKSKLQDFVKLSAIRNTVEPDKHAFVIQGTDKLYFTHLPMFQMENHRQQVIFTADLPQKAKEEYEKARKKNPSHVYFLGNKNKMTLEDIACDGHSFEGVIYKGFDSNEEPTLLIENFIITNVKVLKKRHLAAEFQDANYPKDRMPFYIYGINQQLHIDHILLKNPSIQLSADCVELKLTHGNLREKGVIVHITDLYENAMQPFPEIERHGCSFFFQEGREFNVELYEDPVPDPNQSGPGLDDVNIDDPFAKERLAIYEVKDGKIKGRPLDEPFNKYYYDVFEKEKEAHWYENTIEENMIEENTTEGNEGKMIEEKMLVNRKVRVENSIFWSDALETRLCELYLRDDIVDIFWGHPFNEQHPKGNSTNWNIYVVTRGLHHPYSKKERITDDQVIHFIAEAAKFVIPSDPLPCLIKIPQDLKEKFNEALDNELGLPFREKHYNLVGIGTGYKQVRGEFTETPAIIFYVRQKGILRRGCGGVFPKQICGYPTDVVEACVAIPCAGLGIENCRRYQENVKLGSSIGIGSNDSQNTTGTLSAIAYENKSPNRIGIVSCEHVLRFSEEEKITIVYQPSYKDYLLEPRRKLEELRKSLREFEENEYINDIDEMQRKLNLAESQDSTLATYVKGMRENFLSQVDNKKYGIDAGFCVFDNESRKLCSKNFPILSEYFKNAGFSNCLEGIYTYNELKNFSYDSTRVFKIGRTTGLTIGELLPTEQAIACNLTNESIKIAKHLAMEKHIPCYSNTDQNIFVGYMKSRIDSEICQKRNKCYPIKWFDRQLAFKFEPGEFEHGDSGASVLDEKGKALGILHAKWTISYQTYSIASPYYAILEALDISIKLSSDPINLDSSH
ncbi:PLP-dependent transferase [Rhizophagus clarus]|uniref:PLP-dependent transferase n=1 Tax=Rhizophagus clarus TaxID=94130 RepID=A0A8H3LC98_9GLOM|nr:PLP-dependent transferase [Rhizophagus clarus]